MTLLRQVTTAATVRTIENRDEWNELVRAFDACDARHSWEWGELRARQGWTPLRLAAFGGGECLAAAAFVTRAVPGLGVVAYAPRGPLLDPVRGDVWDAAAALADVARARTGAFMVRTSPAVPVEDAASWAPLEARGFRRLPDLWSLWNTPRNVMRVDLEGQERDLLARMTKKRRQHIATGGKKGVAAEVAYGLAPMHALRTLMLERYASDPVVVPSGSHLAAMLALVLGRINGELAGAALGVRFAGTAHLIYVAVRPSARSLPVGDLMHWAWMRWARDGGCRVLDLGSSCTDVPPSPSHPNYGIYRFKAELGARFRLYAGYYDRVYSGATYFVARHVERWTLRYGRRCAAVLQNLKTALPRWAAVPATHMGLA
jgi:peptidoglycan pentaglycine glycine transferase (the first glycine)